MAMALRVQRVARAHFKRQLVRLMRLQNYAANEVQRVWRGIWARAIVEDMHESARRDALDRVTLFAIEIQRVFRAFLSRNKVWMAVNRRNASIHMQRLARGVRVRVFVEKYRLDPRVLRHRVPMVAGVEAGARGLPWERDTGYTAMPPKRECVICGVTMPNSMMMAQHLLLHRLSPIEHDRIRTQVAQQLYQYVLRCDWPAFGRPPSS